MARLSQSCAEYEVIMRRLEEEGAQCVSHTDPDAPLVCDNRSGLMPECNVQSVVYSKCDIIVEIDSNQNIDDTCLLIAMEQKDQESSKNKVFAVLTDKGYWQGEDLSTEEALSVVLLIAEPRQTQRSDQPS